MSGITDLTKTVMIIAALALIILTFIDTNIGLIAILLSMLLSPELEVGAVAKRAIVIRVEDLILIIVCLTWLAKMAIKKELPLIRKSPLNVPIGLYVAVLFLSTFRGMMTGDVSPLKGMFYVLKLVEYFILYLIVLNHVTTEDEVKRFLFILILTSVIVGIYGNTHIGRVARISAPFEGSGEPNTLGGYLLFIMSILGGLILYYKEKRKALVLIFVFLIPTFIFTLSRASYLGMIPAMFAFGILSKQKQITRYVVILLVAFTLLVVLGPPVIKRRVLGAFQPEESQEIKSVGPITLGPSPAARVASWNEVLTKDFPRQPFLGRGVTGGAFLDSQYIRTLQETGAIGLWLFLWIMWRIWKTAFTTYGTVEKPLFKGLALGYMVGFIGLLVHAIGTNSFIIIRIAEPFWFFTAIVIKLVDIETGKAKRVDLAQKY
jgi:hypothetical protein